MLVDVHAHLDLEQFSIDLDEVINRARHFGVVSIINNGLNPVSNRKTLELSKKYDIVKPALGLYPIDALKLSEEELEGELEFIKKNKPIAIGEVGLDYLRSEEKDKQKGIFQKIITLAEKLSLPLIVHSRKAESEVIDILESSKLKKIIMHCFNGEQSLVKKIEKNGWFFSIPPIILRSLQFQMIVNQVSTTQLLTETDSPYLAPPPKKRNEPIFVSKVIEKISEIKNLNEDEVKKIIFMNYKNIFK